MNDPTEILVPRENVNDESATLVSWLRDDGARVEGGEAVAQIETSKAVMDLAAPAAGVLRRTARAGQEVPVGGSIGRVEPAATEGSKSTPAPSPEDATAVPGETPPGLAPSVRRIVTEHGVDPAGVSSSGRGGRLTKGDVLVHLNHRGGTPDPVGAPPRFTAKAGQLIGQLGIDPTRFNGRGLVRSRDVLAVDDGGASPTGPTAAADPPRAVSRPAPVTGVPTRSEPLSRAKRTEGNYLRSAAETTLASVVTVSCPTRGFRELVGGRTTSILIFETARLLRKYPAFNAFHADGRVHYYEEVNVGFAIDTGKGLRVPVVRAADRKGIAAIELEVRELLVAYLGDSLAVETLAGGTFTLTDLSGEGVSAFHPLINRGQSAILGVCSEALPPGGGTGTFNLVLAFDHQISEGRTAARFLGELRERIGYHESSLRRGDEAAAPAEEPRCSRCMRGYSALASERHSLVQALSRDGSPRTLCTICLEGWS